MTDLKLYFSVDPAAESDALVSSLKKGLQSSDVVEQAEATPETSRLTGLEIYAAISLAANIIHHGHDIIHDTKEIIDDSTSITEVLKKLFAHVVDMVKQTPGVHEARVDVGLRSVPLTQLTDADIAKIADAVVARMKADPQPTT